MTTEQLYRLFLKHPHVETDSRRVKKGTIFFALKGEKFNGNRYAAEALEKGAAFAIIDEEEFVQQDRTILVENVLITLQDLANIHRKKLGIPILAITGSNGKTTTKELIAAVLAEKYEIACTQGNLNNHIGVPLTLLQMNRKTQFGVVEMGANHQGEIATLCSIADPDYGLVTNIGLAHLEGFGSFEIIKKTKSELYDYVKQKKGIIFYNQDNTILKDILADYDKKVSFGETGADITGQPASSAPFIGINLNLHEGIVEISTQLTGNYNFENVMAAVCIGNYFKIPSSRIAKAIQNYRPENNRSQLIEKNGMKIVMDAYNANPTSMKASIESFISLFPGNRYLILGDMLELGTYSREEHISVLQEIANNSFDAVFLVGPVFKEASKDFPFASFQTVAELISYLAKNPLTSGAVLIKGSRGIQLEKVLEIL
jgi:UDP-N-acetylmuramoyl-tripeptide--D-alanyl-D-alanine ligase